MISLHDSAEPDDEASADAESRLTVTPAALAFWKEVFGMLKPPPESDEADP